MFLLGTNVVDGALVTSRNRNFSCEHNYWTIRFLMVSGSFGVVTEVVLQSSWCLSESPADSLLQIIHDKPCTNRCTVVSARSAKYVFMYLSSLLLKYVFTASRLSIVQ